MLEQVPSPQVVRFGTFEVDLRLRELRKKGIRLKLTGQPFQILVILLEHPGDLVTREQLQRQLWPSDTFVDFDRGLNAAINRVRGSSGGLGGESALCGNSASARLSFHSAVSRFQASKGNVVGCRIKRQSGADSYKSECFT